MVTLENEFLKVNVSSKGAELTSIYNKFTRVEHIWQADPGIWGFHAPNLFPVVGECNKHHILVDGKKYPMQRHGFARYSEFSLLETTDIHAKFSLDYSDATLAVYPYKFTFQVLYDLFDSELRISYKVINQDDTSIWFSVGAHPAFNIPFYKGETYEDYYIEFEQDESLVKHSLTDDGYFNSKTQTLHTEMNKLNLTKSLFAEGALVFKELLSRRVIIRNHKTPNFISVSFLHFNSLGIWAAPGAPFVCIEPWLGYADREDELTDFHKKEGIQMLEQGHVFEVDFLIGIY